MIIFWILTFFVGASAFAFALIGLQLGIVGSIIYAGFAMLVCRGILSLFKRWLVVREHVSAEPDVLERTIETNRAIFWRRSLWLTALPAVYFALMYFIFGLAPLDAVLLLPSILQAFFGQMIYLVFLMFANFALILGPFYILSRIGNTTIVPDDARTFGMDALFQKYGIYAHAGQKYEPVDKSIKHGSGDLEVIPQADVAFHHQPSGVAGRGAHKLLHSRILGDDVSGSLPQD